MKPKKDLRDHGRPDPTEVGIPRVVGSTNNACPHCGCRPMFMIEVDCRMQGIDGPAVGVYAGCAACPWASVMMTRKKAPVATEKADESSDG